MSYTLFGVMVNMMVYICPNLANFTLKIGASYCMYNIIQKNKKLKVVASREQGRRVEGVLFSLHNFCITF